MDEEVYKDRLFSCLLPESPATKGHVHVAIAAERIEDITPQEFAHLLCGTSFISNAIFESAKVQGTNIVISDLDSVQVDVLGRNENDDLGFSWTPSPADQEKLDGLTKKIKDKCDYVSVDTGSQAVPKQETSSPRQPVQKVVKKEEDEEINYLIKRLDRIP